MGFEHTIPVFERLRGHCDSHIIAVFIHTINVPYNDPLFWNPSLITECECEKRRDCRQLLRQVCNACKLIKAEPGYPNSWSCTEYRISFSSVAALVVDESRRYYKYYIREIYNSVPLSLGCNYRLWQLHESTHILCREFRTRLFWRAGACHFMIVCSSFKNAVSNSDRIASND
jgi:hypothetical protein